MIPGRWLALCCRPGYSFCWAAVIYEKGQESMMMDLIPYRACYIDKIQQTMIFSSSLFNGIFRMDLNNKTVQTIGMIQGEKIFQGSLYGSIVACGKWLFLVPLAAREIAVLERESGRCVRKIRLPGNAEIGWKFAAGVVYGDDVILIPARYPYFLSIDIVDLSVKVLQDWTVYLAARCALDEQKQLSAFTVGRLADTLYLQVLDTDFLLKFDMKSKRIIGVIDLPEAHYAYAICDERNIYVVPSRHGEILCIGMEDDRIKMTYPMPIKVDENMEGYVSIHGRIVCERLILFPQMAAEIGVVDLKTGKTGHMPFDYPMERNKKNIVQKVEMIDDQYCIALVCYEDKKRYGCFLVDIVNLSMKSLKMELEQSVQEILRGCMQQSMAQNEIIKEYTLEMLGVKDPFNMFIAAREENMGAEGTDGDRVGAKIFHTLKGDR